MNIRRLLPLLFLVAAAACNNDEEPWPSLITEMADILTDEEGTLCQLHTDSEVNYQLTNPVARVYLEWSAVGGADAAAKRLTGRGIRLISAQDLARMGGWRDSGFGLCLMTGDAQVNLATPVWQWGAYYEAILQRIRNKSFRSEYQESRKALNYYWGLSAGVVGLHCSNKLPQSAKKLASLLRDAICSGSCSPFRGPLYAQDGRQIIGEKETLSTEDIISMDYLVDTVVGTIPAYEELSDTGKATVGIVGVPATKEKQN